MAQSILKTKSFLLAKRVVFLYKFLAETKKEFTIAKQLLRCGTSVGAMIREAQNAESKKDFVHKLAIAQKECDETLYWLELLKECNILSQNEFESIYLEAEEILKMITKAIVTTKQKMQ